MNNIVKQEKDNIIVKIVEGWCNFKIKLIDTIAQTKIKTDKVNHAKYKSEADSLPLRMEIEELKIQSNAMKDIRKRAKVYAILAAIGTFASVLLTVCGITGCDNFGQLFKSAQNVAYILMIFFTQYVVYYVGKDTTILKKNFFINYNYFVALKIGITFTSVTCNYIFLVKFMKPENFIYYIFLLILACSLDLISLTLSSMANDCKNLQYSYKDYNEDVSALTMIGFVASEKIKGKIRSCYNNQLETYKKDVLKLTDNQKQICSKNTQGVQEYRLFETSHNYQYVPEKIKENLLKNLEPDEGKKLKNLEQNKEKVSKNLEHNKEKMLKNLEPDDKKVLEQAKKMFKNLEQNTQKQEKNDKIILDKKVDLTKENEKVLHNVSNKTNDIKSDKTNNESTHNLEQNRTQVLREEAEDCNQKESVGVQEDMIKRNDNSYENVLKKLEEFASGDRISIKQMGLRINGNNWRSIRRKLLEKGLVYTKGTNTYKK